ncbi:ABC transporter ATP-binding protein [Negadavirga shengliensis]|uniref:ABC transporter ATP-binding protein n=1 Tax=Negadavirga shengliensis TaxID=1389218 RepID=A0ABV9T5B5_9BACT
MDHIIELVELTKKYGDYTAVDRLNLKIRTGEVFGLLGPNGAGKSTTILMMLGLTEPSSGKACVCGINATTHPVEVKRKVGYLPEDVGFYEDLTGMENLLYTARLNGMHGTIAQEKASELLEKVGLGKDANKKAGKYSRGMRQRLGLADVLIKNPVVIILDEPTLGIDPNGVRELLELIQKLSREEGLTVLLSSHHLHQVQQVCDRVGLFVSGQLKAVGNIQELSNQLFSNHNFMIQVKVGGSPALSKNGLHTALLQLKAVEKIDKQTEGWINIGCSEDITPVIAQTIVDAGAELYHLSRKSYGLDDIYQLYFEGGKKHENHTPSQTNVI